MTEPGTSVNKVANTRFATTNAIPQRRKKAVRESFNVKR